MANGNHDPRNYITEAQVATLGTHKQVAIGAVGPNPWNYNVQGDEVFAKLVESMRTFGFVEPVLVRTLDDGKYQIVNGEHRWRAGKLAGMKTIPVIDLGALSDDRAKQLTIILNELGGQPDEVKLAELLRDINEMVPLEELSKVMPYTKDELNMYLEVVSFSFDKMATGDTRPPKEKEDEEAADAAEGMGGSPDHQGGVNPGQDGPDPKQKRLIFEMDSARADTLLAKLRGLRPDDPVAAIEQCVDYWIKNATAARAASTKAV